MQQRTHIREHVYAVENIHYIASNKQQRTHIREQTMQWRAHIREQSMQRRTHIRQQSVQCTLDKNIFYSP